MAVIQGERQYQMVKLTLASGDSIEATAEHPFYIKGKGWNPASSLKVGQALQLHNGTTVVINEIDTSVGVEKVYNLTVANTHNYFVGGDGVLVHNGKGGGKEQKGKCFRGGKKKDRDNWYGHNDKNFQKWWHREGKKDFNDGMDIEDAANAKEAFDYWDSIGRPTPK